MKSKFDNEISVAILWTSGKKRQIEYSVFSLTKALSGALFQRSEGRISAA
jgi:hypothetical protein